MTTKKKAPIGSACSCRYKPKESVPVPKGNVSGNRYQDPANKHEADSTGEIRWCLGRQDTTRIAFPTVGAKFRWPHPWTRSKPGSDDTLKSRTDRLAAFAAGVVSLLHFFPGGLHFCRRPARGKCKTVSRSPMLPLQRAEHR